MSDTNPSEIDYKTAYEKASAALMRLMIIHEAAERGFAMSLEYQNDTIAMANDVLENQLGNEEPDK